MNDSAVTVAETVERLAAELAAARLVFGHGYASAWDEAVALVLHVTGLPDDAAVLGQPIDARQHRAVAELARRRREERIPIAYLLGRCRLAGAEFLVEPGVVIPRSPIGALLANGLSPWLRAPPERVVDVCCGSGCLGIVAALAFPDARVDLADIDPAALRLAQRNVAHHGLEPRVRVHRSDLLDDLPPGRWDLIVSNPPYVDASDMASLPPEYRHEPTRGLAGGPDGLALVDRILAALPARLAARGLLVCEVGASAAALLRRHPRRPFIWPALEAGGEGVFLLVDD